MFDYPLRSKEEVIQEFKYDMPEIEITVEKAMYVAGDMREHGD